MSSHGWPRLRKEVNKVAPNTSSREDEAHMEPMKQRTDPRVQTTSGELPRRRMERLPVPDRSSSLPGNSHGLTLEPPLVPSKLPPPVPPKDPRYTRSLPVNRPTGVQNPQQALRSEPRREERLTSKTVRWPFFSKDEPNSAGSGSSIRRSNAIRRRTNTGATAQGKPHDDKSMEDCSSWFPGDDAFTIAMKEVRRGKPLLMSHRTGNTPAHTPAPTPVQPLHLPQRPDRSHTHPPGPVPQRPRTAKGYTPRPFDEPAPQSVVDDLRNAWQGIQRPLKVHAMPPEVISRRGQPKPRGGR
ncbi:hypothetical protein F5Y06DRAFT_272611 [Hypoxylon sp. FL0890]|nr:hypothetical protein F5Y06DRAFT_272611 [Hypoxylon sp. FL0890]